MDAAIGVSVVAMRPVARCAALVDPRLVAAIDAFPTPLRARLDRTAAVLGLTPVDLALRILREELDHLDRQKRSRASRDRLRRCAAQVRAAIDR